MACGALDGARVLVFMFDDEIYRVGCAALVRCWNWRSRQGTLFVAAAGWVLGEQ